jgi:hypothetical protein
MAKQDRLLDRIHEFSEAKGGGVLIRKLSKGYSLFREDTGKPVARLRPTGKADHVELLLWRREKWGRIGGFGPLVLPLDEALEYIARDPMGVFWR